MEQLVDILDAQLQELKPREKDSAGRSFNKVEYTTISMSDFMSDGVDWILKLKNEWFDSLLFSYRLAGKGNLYSQILLKPPVVRRNDSIYSHGPS